MLKVEVSYPNLVEQDQICNIMEKIDEIITLHQRKYFPIFHNTG